MENSMGMPKYNIDIALCIDATGSMDPIIEKVKSAALDLPNQIINRFSQGNKEIAQLRVKVIFFQDFASEGANAIQESPFLVLPDDVEIFQQIVNGVDYKYKGGDDPENGLEAICTAMKSDWCPKSSYGCRHIVVMLTDAYPLHLQERAGCAGYDESKYYADIEEMRDVWEEGKMSQSMCSTSMIYGAHRLIIFGPAGQDEAMHSWQDLVSFDRGIFTEVNPAAGLADIELTNIVEEIFKSV